MNTTGPAAPLAPADETARRAQFGLRSVWLWSMPVCWCLAMLARAPLGRSLLGIFFGAVIALYVGKACDYWRPSVMREFAANSWARRGLALGALFGVTWTGWGGAVADLARLGQLAILVSMILAWRWALFLSPRGGWVEHTEAP